MAQIALVGCGMWGRNIARNLKELGALAAVSDVDAERGANFAAQFSCDSASYEALLSHDNIDGVMLATNASTHRALAVQALEAGKHVFIEKPMALTLEDGHAIKDAVTKTHKQVMVGHLIRYHSAFQALLTQIESGAIGRPKHIQANRLAMGRIRNTESALFDLCPHDLSLILALSQTLPTQVICHGVSHISPNNVDILTTALSFDGGLSAHMHTSWLSPYKEHRLSVTGETGSLVFDDTKPWSEKLTLYQDSITQAGDLFMIERASPLHVTVPESEPLKDEVRSFIRLCDDGVLPPTHIDEALNVQIVLEEMQNQLQDLNKT